MDQRNLRRLIGFYENELTNRILSFWLPRCQDTVHGGFFNCFDNRGEKLVSHDKYTWSQGRFGWLFAKLASMGSPTFNSSQRRHFLDLAQNGCDFLMQHCLMGKNDWRCVFLMDETGSPKPVKGWKPLDMSLYADCFVVAAMTKYASVSGDVKKYQFGKLLYESCLDRIDSGRYNTLPYPLASHYRAHGIPMIFSHVTAEMLGAAQKFETESDYCDQLRANLTKFTEDILQHFVDSNNVVHEIIRSDHTFFPGLLGQHANPGHTLEDMWFMLDAADILGKPEWTQRIASITGKALKIGWDERYGGIIHFCGVDGGQPPEPSLCAEQEPMLQQVQSGWSDKLWWVHSEALYTTLLCHERTGDSAFLDWHDRIFDYVFATFPNPDPEIREWIQIRKQDGTPQDKVVALPVKDPYHIARNLILIIELLYRMLDRLAYNSRFS